MSATCDLFVLPGAKEDERILYAPLNRRMASVNAAAEAAVDKWRRGLALTGDEQAVIDQLAAHGFFNECEAPRPNREFKPVHVTLFPTDACNLRCRYCYASACTEHHHLSMDAARAAIDLVADNAKALGRENFLVGFHGNGEPFMGFDVIEECCEYTREAARRVGLRGVLSTATNGVLTDAQRDFAIGWFDNINVSFDILPDVQDRQRPFPDGSGSWEVVDRTLRRFDEALCNYGIRSTVTEQSAHRIPEMALFTRERYPHCSILHLEPAWEIGRALDTGEKTPETQAFIDGYLSAIDAMGNKGLTLVYSGARADLLMPSFCSVCKGTFTVTAEGLVTSCYEVCTYDDPRGERYIYGRFDPAAKAFLFDGERLDDLETLQVSNMPFCKDCFCRWHCAGDCAAKVLGDKPATAHAGSARCEITRALTRRQILRKMGLMNQEKEGTSGVQ